MSSMSIMAESPARSVSGGEHVIQCFKHACRAVNSLLQKVRGLRWKIASRVPLSLPSPARGEGEQRPLGLEAFVDFGPVDRVPDRLQVIRAAVLVLQVVGVLPDVDSEDRN